MMSNLKSHKVGALVSAIVLSTSIMASSMITIMNHKYDEAPIVLAGAETSTADTSSSESEEPDSGSGRNYEYAYDYEDGFSGNEKATDIGDFHNDYTVQTMYKIYCAFRSMGMSKVQAVAALGSCACEGSFHSEIIEYATPNDSPDTPVLETGSHTHGSVDGALGSLENRENYIEEWSQYVEDPEMRTKFTDDTMRSYGISNEIIDKKHNGEALGSVGTARGFSLAIDYYYDSDGFGTTGCGLWGFTGGGHYDDGTSYGSLYRLFDWAAEHELQWYDEDAQISYVLADYADGGYGGGSYSVSDYIEMTKDLGVSPEDIDVCVEKWCPVIGWVSPSWLSARQTKAKEIMTLFPTDNWDAEYGNKIVAMAGKEDCIVGDSDEIQDEGILAHYVQPAVLYPQSGGYLISAEQNQDLYDNNSAVFTEYVASLQDSSNPTDTFSLFELFGEDLHWYRYFGETTHTPKLLDHIWSAVDQDKTDQLLNHPIATIQYEASNYLSCQVYPGRPEVLSVADLDNGDVDPRVSALTFGMFNGYDYVLGDFNMTISKYIVSMVSFLAGPDLLNDVVEVLEKIEESDNWKYIKVVVMVAVGFAMVGFILSIVKKAFHYAKGTGAARDVITRFVVGFLALGLIFAGCANPAILNGTIKNGIGVIDTMFNSALAKAIENDEVIAVVDEDKATHAALWKTAIFNAWCRGQFSGMEYKELYTQFSTLESGQSKMPQSHDKLDYTDMSGDPIFDSATLTGDVGVPVGGGKTIKNWAAYLYSCGTKYHIDSTLDKDGAANIDTTKAYYFPHSSLVTTANDPSLEADVFRIVDAQYNISPQYFVSGSEINSYINANEKLKTHYIRESTKMLVNSGLLIFLVPVIYQKMFNFILLMITIFKMIWFSLMELVKPDSGLGEFWSTLKKHFFGYFVASMKLCLLVSLYYMFVDKGFVMGLIYCILCLVILSFNLREMMNTFDKAKNKIKSIRAHHAF